MGPHVVCLHATASAIIYKMPRIIIKHEKNNLMVLAHFMDHCRLTLNRKLKLSLFSTQNRAFTL